MKKYKNLYYIYLHIDPITSQVVYVGKGSSGRAWKFYNRSKKHLKWIEQLKLHNAVPIVKIAHVFVKEKDALDREKILIAFLLNKGVKLFNVNKGGGGSPTGPLHPMYGKPKTEEVKNKISKALKGRPRPDIVEFARQKMTGNTIKRGTKSKQETKDKISKSLVGNKRRSEKIVCVNNSKVYDSVKEAWTELGLDERSVFRVLKGEYSHTKGYIFRYLNTIS